MSRLKLEDGIWSRCVPKTWYRAGVWRTDVPSSLLKEPGLRAAEFHLGGGPTIQVPARDLCRALARVESRRYGRIRGPFDIDPRASTLAGLQVEMVTVSSR